MTKAHIGIEAIIKTIRSTSNPRTSQRALLVAAELARLIPDTVLHNVMPIFTFMGAADFQRDDAYSFGVVERTVKGIVPVLVGSLRETAGSGLALWNGKSLSGQGADDQQRVQASSVSSRIWQGDCPSIEHYRMSLFTTSLSLG